MSTSSSSFPRTIVSYTLSTSLFIVFFLCSVFLFTRRALEPSLSPYHADIPLPDPRPPIEPLPSKDLNGKPHDADADLTVDTNPKKEEADPRRDDDVAVNTKPKATEDSDGAKPDLEDEGASRKEESVEENNAESAEEQAVVEEKLRGCDLYKGSWVKDGDEYPLYQPGSCPYVDEAFDCQRNGRRDSDYLNWRWKPDGCDLPRYRCFSSFISSSIVTPDSSYRQSFDQHFTF